MITALLVSVNYSDYLEIALPYNSLQFDQIIILTIESDKSCQEACSKYSNVKCLVFPDDILKKNGKVFNKGAILNKGLEYLNDIGYSDWLVLTDSDIIFPENFREVLLSKEKDSNILYGMIRRHCIDLQTFKLFTQTKNPNRLRHQKNEFPFIGYCQTFIYQANKFKFVEHYDAERSDILFLKHFYDQFNYMRALKNRPENFVMLSDTDFVIHLGEHKKNWKGRVTVPFI